MRQTIDQMFEGLANGPQIYQPSEFWKQLNEKNVQQLEKSGIGNIKRTLAQNYFTWVVGMRSPLFKHLVSLMTKSDWKAIITGLPLFSRESGLGLRRFYELQIFTRMVWIVAKRVDRMALLNTLIEPEFGNPFQTFFKGRLISQDLANSVIELYSALEARMPLTKEAFTVCEVGAGYGRNAYTFLSVFEKCKYIIVDIPPALYVSQEYITHLFPNKSIMSFRDFSSFDEISEEFYRADVIFLLPHQSRFIPKKSVNYFINISSFHEMNFDQISEYFDIVDQLTDGYFYIKQWKLFENTDDKITISESDYPYREKWSPIYSRTPSTHPLFFEKLIKIEQTSI
jgi:putative sugar O-methyltransferase